jgi:signal transduction histidine kinase
MLASIELFAYGAATVIDTVLLVTLVDARNYARVMLPIVLLTCGTWLFHFGTFFHAYFESLETPWSGELHWWAMSVMALGLIIMPSAMLHLLLRLARTGVVAHPPFAPVFGLAYAPLMLVPIVIARFAADPEGRFLDICRPWVWPYVGWTAAVNVTAAVVCFRLKLDGQAPFYRVLGVTLLGMTLLVGIAAPLALVWPDGLPALQTVAVLAPLLPVVLFTYFVVRFNFLQLFVERTLLYAAVAIVLLLVYQLALHDVHMRIEDRYGINVEILQGALVFLLILLLPPLRLRILESLRYLVAGKRIVALRDQIRRIAVHITEHAGEPPAELFASFAVDLRQALRLAYVSGWLVGDRGELIPVGDDILAIEPSQLKLLYGELAAQPHILFTRRDGPSGEAHSAMHAANASAAMAFAANRVHGLIMLGRRERNRDFGEEEASILMVLAEQLAVAMDNSQLQAQRLAAERRAFQNERLTTLGLLAGAVAHEIKNPLSSIKTIATVLGEDLGPDSPHADDLRLIVNETHRLAVTTSQLLGFARPPVDAGAAGSVVATLNVTLAVLRHLARQEDIELIAHIPAELPAVRIVGPALQEIFLNLLNNGIEAAGRGGQVSVICHHENGHVITEVRDTGPGIAPDIQDQLFQPFITTKESGTGLGLYIVSCRVREAGGEISCQSRANQGTTFVIRLPVAHV